MSVATPFVMNATQILVGDYGQRNFQSGCPIAFSTGSGQIDDVIGFTNKACSTSGCDSLNMYHWIQWSTKSTVAAGNVLNLWVSY